MIKHIILLLLTPLALSLSAQDTVLDKNVEEQYTEKRGPNMRQYGHVYEAIGIVLPYNSVSGAKTDMARSVEFIIGYRYKLKLLSFYAIGFDLSNRWANYGITSEGTSVPVDVSANPLSRASEVDKMKMVLSSLGAEAYNRINIGKRGNVLGNYLDIGIKGEWNYGRKLIVKDKAAEGDYFEKSRLVEKNLKFIEKFSTLVTARIGVNKVSIYGNYRFSDLVTSGYSTPELPPLTAGIQYAF